MLPMCLRLFYISLNLTLEIYKEDNTYKKSTLILDYGRSKAPFIQFFSHVKKSTYQEALKDGNNRPMTQNKYTPWIQLYLILWI